MYDLKVIKSFFQCVICWIHLVSNAQMFSRLKRRLAAMKCTDILPKLYVSSLALEQEG